MSIFVLVANDDNDEQDEARWAGDERADESERVTKKESDKEGERRWRLLYWTLNYFYLAALVHGKEAEEASAGKQQT